MTTATLNYPKARISTPVLGSPAAPAPRLRLTARGRRLLTALVVVPLAIAALVFAVNGGAAIASGEGSVTSFEYITVEPGESLWQLAEQLAPQADPRDVIADLMALNQLESADVFAGQELAVPADYAG